ncbi:MAG: sulfotransferase domain-containing protein [Rhodospirillaceae bacterium]
MTVPANGLPKTGCHALAKTIELLGEPSGVIHQPWDKRPEPKAVTIIRNPRNALVSWLRWRGEPLTQGMLITAMRRYYEDRPLAEQISGYTPYLLSPDYLVVRFEELFSDGGGTVERIAAYLGVPVLDDCYPNIMGLTQTWTGRLSNWEEHWTPEVEAVWQAEGIAEAAKSWNY